MFIHMSNESNVSFAYLRHASDVPPSLRGRKMFGSIVAEVRVLVIFDSIVCQSTLLYTLLREFPKKIVESIYVRFPYLC